MSFQPALSGATAETSGFAQAGDVPSSQQVSVGHEAQAEAPSGGLASNPLVPKPGTTINPETGKPHTAGLTRAELQAKRDAEAAISAAAGVTASSDFGDTGDFGGGFASNPLVPKPGTTINPETGKPHTAGLTRAELQAKRDAEAAISAAAGVTASSDFGDTGAFGGGLASNPLVPRPGTSINPETGKPHTAGLTRAELQAKRDAEAAASAPTAPSELTSPIIKTGDIEPEPEAHAKPVTAAEVPPNQPGTSGVSDEELQQIKSKGAELLDPTPLAQQARRSSHSQTERPTGITGSGTDQGGRRLSDLTGREQAARQLTSTAYPTTGEITPGLELPGAWGPTKAIPFPGTAPGAPTSIYEDVTDGLNKVGQAAFAAIPSPIKEAFSAQQPPKSPKASTSPRLSATGSPRLGASQVEGRRSSVTALFDSAKERATKVASDVQGTLQETLQSTQRRASASLPRDSEIFKNVKGFMNEAFAGPGPAAASRDFGIGIYPSGPGRGVPMHIAPRFSSPSEASADAVPGERSGADGALPRAGTESGVAVLPEEKKAAASLPSQENQGVRPGETSDVLGSLSGKPGEPGAAVLPQAPTRASTAYSELKPASSSSGSGLASGPGSTDLTSDLPTTGTATQRSVGSIGLPSAAPSSITNEAGAESSTDTAAPTTAGPAFGASTGPAFAGLAASGSLASGSLASSTAAPEPSTSALGDSSTSSEGLNTSETSSSVLPSTSGTSFNDTAKTSTGTSNLQTSHGGLAAPLPSTFLGQGADKGATDIPITLGTDKENVTSSFAGAGAGAGTSSAIGTAGSTARGSAASSLLSPDSVVPDTRHGNERTTSSASVTAIRHGHEGTVSQSSPLAGEGITVPEHEELSTSTSSPIGSGLKSTTPGTGPNHTTSLSPGDESAGIGHPSTRGVEGATREPSSYPAADHARDVGHDHSSAATATDSTSTVPVKLDEEKRKAGAVVDAPAQSTPTERKEDAAVAPSHAPATATVDTSSKVTPIKTEASTSTPSPKTSSPATPLGKSSTPPSPASPRVDGTGTGNGSGTGSGTGKNASAHARQASTGSEKKKGSFLGKIKEKLKH